MPAFDPIILYIASLILLFIAGVLVVIGFVPEEIDEEEHFGIRVRKRKRLIEESSIYRLTLPITKIFAHYIAQVPDSDNIVEDLRDRLREKLPASGYVGGFTPNEFLGMCCTVALGSTLGLILLTTMLLGKPALVISVLLGLTTAYFPFVQLDNIIQERLFQIDRELPYTIDLILLSMRAGLDFMTALDRVVTRGLEQNPEDPIMQELGVVLQEIKVGTSKSEALLNMCGRVESEYLDSMVGSIIQSEEKGTPLAEILEIQVETIRDKRTARVEKAASSASVKILFPLIFILVSVLTLIFGMMGLSMFYGTA